MKINFLIDYLAYISVRLLSLIFILMPTNLAMRIGRAIGTLAYYIDVRHKAVAYDNISFVFSAEKNIFERKQILKKLFQNFALSIVELLRLPVVTTSYFEKYIEIEGRDHIQEALKKGKGLIFLAVHFGSWELSNIICAKLGLTYKVIAREQKRFSKLNKLLNSYRQSQGTVVITRGVTTREIVRSLSFNEVVGMVADQGGRDGCLIEFFGKDASMPTGAIRLALKFEVPILVAFLVRKYGPFHKVIIKPQLKLLKTDSLEQDILINLRNVVKVAEELIKLYPEQYMWFYKIWKYSLTRSIVILNDGKIGHLRQSQALANIITEHLRKRNFNPLIKIININFKNKIAKQLVTFSAVFARKNNCKGCLWCLKNSLEDNSFLKILNSDADFVISCGQALAAVNFILSRERSAKSITVLNPGILGFKRFDLVVMPEHDRPPKRNNIILTMGALNLISDDYLKKESSSLLSGFPDLSANQRIKIGLFLGGDTKKYVLTKETVEKTLSELKNICNEFDFELLITTSRRTSKRIENILKKEMANFSKCKLIIIAHENDHLSSVGGILGLASIVVVSGESISMVSEAASSGKTVVVFRLPLRQGLNVDKDKHEIFLQNMLAQGFLHLASAENIGQTLSDVILNKKTTKKLDDNFTLLKAIEKIL
ncbi:MAG: ELM1/GtrOC1 family putative glycosyltransferase [Candidatus Omnitrophota bacterium]|nr:ELM1/GtrOC1 family putative glycosyltransferase [Candidatus Omnitrophota bacterium]